MKNVGFAFTVTAQDCDGATVNVGSLADLRRIALGHKERHNTDIIKAMIDELDEAMDIEPKDRQKKPAKHITKVIADAKKGKGPKVSDGKKVDAAAGKAKGAPLPDLKVPKTAS